MVTSLNYQEKERKGNNNRGKKEKRKLKRTKEKEKKGNSQKVKSPFLSKCQLPTTTVEMTQSATDSGCQYVRSFIFLAALHMVPLKTPKARIYSLKTLTKPTHCLFLCICHI